MSEFKKFDRRAREWLEPNDLDTDSYVRHKVVVEDTWEECDLRIADCGRRIDLCFDCSEDGLIKLDRLIGSLQAFRLAMVGGMKAVKKRSA